MKTFKKIDYIVISVFLLIEVALYLSFLLLDFKYASFDDLSTILKYSSIILCLVCSLYFGLRKRNILNFLIPIALTFTLISDYFLLINNDVSSYSIGLITFIIAQLIYFVLISLIFKSLKAFLINLVFRIVLTSIVIVVLYLLKEDNLETFLALSYFVELLANFIFSLFLIKTDKRLILFSVGLLLFICCDINVGLNNVHIIPNLDYEIVNNLMRLFYLPSQTLICLTNFNVEKYKLRLV